MNLNRYVLKINNSTFVSDINWIAMVIPEIKTDLFENSMIITDEYLDYIVDGHTKKELILRHYPHIQIIKVRLVIDA